MIRMQSLDQSMRHSGLDGLICRLPENIVYLTGTLPVNGASAVFYLPDEKPILFQPDCESQWVKPNRCDVELFAWGHLGNPDLYISYRNWFSQLLHKFGDRLKSIGLEIDYPVAAPSYSSAEALLPAIQWQDMMTDIFHHSSLQDCEPIFVDIRAIKEQDELDLLRRSNEIAELGLHALQLEIHPGMPEVQAAALVESTIRIKGTGYQGAQLVKAYAQVTSGAEGTYKQSMLTPSGLREFQNGDLVMIEMATCADGYWSDLTRVYSVGKPSSEQIQIYNIVLAAQSAAAKALLPGNTWSSPDQAARSVIEAAGYGSYFKHGTGHGVGYRYHETIPQLSPGNKGIFKKGMVTSVEPGIYIPGFGGIRIEDNLAVGENGPVWLSCPCEPWN
jgi:Xaa-Pro dipeptidase